MAQILQNPKKDNLRNIIAIMKRNVIKTHHTSIWIEFVALEKLGNSHDKSEQVI
jgi:hypothetical protein